METHILFFILAGVLIAILIGAGVWSARREKSQVFSNTFSTRPPSSPINTGLNSEVPASLATSAINTQPAMNEQAQLSQHFAQTPPNDHDIEQSVSSIKISLSNQQAVSSAPVSSQPVFAEQQTMQPQTTQQTAVMHEPQVQLQPEPQQAQENAVQQEAVTDVPKIITLYVVAAEGQQFYGENVVQNLEALGFQYGEYQIFHRHLDNASSPVLFSVANMMQPGVFDLNNLDQFATIGLTFFMQLPSAGNDLANLRLLIRSVESFAQAVGGFVLNDQHQLFDETSRQAYLSQVRQQ